MSRLRVLKQGDDFAIVNEPRDFHAGSIRPEYKVRDCHGDQIAVVSSMDEAVVALAAHLSANPPQWEDGGRGSYMKVASEYSDELRVKQNRDGSWTAYRNDYELVDANGAVTFPTPCQAQRAAELHANDGHPTAVGTRDGLFWLAPSDNAEDQEEQYWIEHLLGETVADAAEAISRARTEHSSGGMQPDTAEMIRATIRHLQTIREASFFGSYDTERGTRVPYFVVIESGQQAAAPARVSFDEAAHHYGKIALRERLGPDVSDTVLREMISAVLKRIPSPDRRSRAA
jgi:hypothetical protein